jgi:hypothetical protein
LGRGNALHKRQSEKLSPIYREILKKCQYFFEIGDWYGTPVSKKYIAEHPEFFGNGFATNRRQHVKT